MLKHLLPVMCVVLVPAVVPADVASGPAVGTAIAPLKVDVVTGEKAGKELDFAAERGTQPTVYVFVHAEHFDRPIGRYLKTLEEAVAKHNGKAAVVAVWLTDQKDSTKTRLEAVQKSLQFQATTLTVHPSLTDLPDGWGLNTDAHLTTVVVADGKVTANFAYISANDTLVRDAAAELAKVVK